VAISRATGISQSSCYNLLKTLAGEGLLHFDESRKLYAIGLGVLELVRGALGSDAILRAARPVMDVLSKNHEATVGLWRAGRHDRMTLIALGESTASTRIHMEVGQRQPRGAGAAGRAWLAAADFSGAEIERLFGEVRWQRPVTFHDYEASIVAARTNGFAEDRELVNRSIVTMASAVRSMAGSGHPSHVLSASVFAGSRDEEGLAALGAAVAQAARRLENEPLS
jgi:DNA-binding IclR family transcriptional regulator